MTATATSVRSGRSGRSAPCVQLSAVASSTLRPLIDGPSRPVRELARFSRALYLVVDERGRTAPTAATAPGAPVGAPDSGPPAGAPVGHRAPVIALLGPGAVAVPGGLQLTRALDPWPAAPCTGTVGVGRLMIDGSTVVVHRWWDPVPRLGSTTPQALRERAARVVRRLDVAGGSGPDAALLAALERVLTGLAKCDDAAAARAADAMIGLGAGLTPSGDDLLAGLLASIPSLQASIASRLRGPTASAAAGSGTGAGVPATDDAAIVDAAQRLAAHVADRADGRTTTVSAELLRHAASGAVARPVLALLHALTGRGAIESATTGLLRVGSSSGHDLTVGILAAVDLLTGHRRLHRTNGSAGPPIHTLPRGS